ncbi:MAG: sugar phosphate nucleotidyltransferase, partial [Firmicutes bacterium]|nr:sugar phosphate nucleotidyltransferase [Bacillota bacterium]
MKAVIMAGGRGTRLRPLTCYVPKPMVPLLDRPCMEYIVDLLKRHEISDIAVTVQYLPQVISGYFGDGSDLGVNMQIFEESVPLGTAGSVKNCEAFLDETFVVISGDGLTDFDLTDIVRFHKQKGAMATIVMTKVDVPLEYGVIMTEADGRITRFLEKPSWSEVFSDTVNTGIYILEPEVLALFEKGQEFDFSKDLFPLMLERDMPLFGYVAQGYWSDIGSLEQYRQTQFDMLMGLVDVTIRGEQRFPRVWVGHDVQIDETAHVQGPSFLGDGVTIAGDAQIGPYAVVGRHTQIAARVTMERSVTWHGNYIGPTSMLNGATLCSNLQIGNGVDICEAAVIGEKTRVGDLCVIRPGVKIWPEKAIGDGTIQSSSLIWGNAVLHSLFDEDGISGLANVELIPEMVGRIASSYGSSVKKGSIVSVSCDEYPYCTVLKLSVVASLLAVGLEVRDV